MHQTKYSVLKTTILTAGLLVAAHQAISAPAQKADNFVLIDQNGQAQELYYQRDAKAIVMLAAAGTCEASPAALKALESVAADYSKAEVRVFAIDSVDSRPDIVTAASSNQITYPILHDSAQIIGPSLQLAQAGETLVIDPASFNIVFRGPISDAGVRAAIDALLAGKVPEAATIMGNGCAINNEEQPEIASYARDIVPILEKNCMACHIEGGIGPWAMTEYRMILGFAPMMREVIRVKRMPPWHADPAVGTWQHSAALSNADTRTLINWIEAGAPRGDGDDPLVAERAKAIEWPLGEPDLILEIPSFDVPATGIVDYQFPSVANPLDHDAWVRAATIIPGNTSVVHHVLMGSADKPPEGRAREGVFENYIMGYAPGNESAFMPDGTGVFVPVGGVYLFQLHYTPTGVATTDKTRVGIYFADEPPANFLRQHVVLNPRIKIPANDGAHPETAYFEFWDDAVIYSLVPHAHYRGKSSSFELLYPDGERELILSVPNYNFNWQRTYSFTEPKQVPKGTRIIHTTVYDNSARNPGNPDPDREVPWGLQSFDEMLYGSVSFSWTHERSDAPLHSKLASDTAQLIGFLDKDMDGKLSKEELPRRMRESIGWWKWWFVDTNFDGGLDREEMESLMKRGRGG